MPDRAGRAAASRHSAAGSGAQRVLGQGQPRTYSNPQPHQGADSGPIAAGIMLGIENMHGAIELPNRAGALLPAARAFDMQHRHGGIIIDLPASRLDAVG